LKKKKKKKKKKKRKEEEKERKNGARCNISEETFKINPKKIHYRTRSPKQDCYTCLENIWTMFKDNPLKWFIFISSYLKRFRTSKL
jgi:hypothetical protein